MSTKKIMTHVVAGYPSMKKCEEVVLKMARYGADFIEIQIPFSDPVADGEVIARANQVALEKGVRVEDCFKLMQRMAGKIEVPLLFMTYFNIVHHYGVAKFCKRAKECGAYGLIVPDMPVDEEGHEGFLKECKKNGLMAVQVISPLTPEERLKKIAKHASGFVYCVSRYGTTGARGELNPKLSAYLKKVRKYIDLPLAVGFGISDRAQIEAVHKLADIAVIGSAILKKVDEGKDFEKILG